MNKKIFEYLNVSLLAIFAILIAFPKPDLDITIGIDSPLAWVFNYLFDNELIKGKNIIFPHGPLAFFMYPKGDNYFFGLSVKLLF